MNRIERLPESFSDLRNLTSFSAEKNFLFQIPPLKDLKRLTRLNLDANELRTLPKQLGQLPLKVLRASHNRLETLNDDTFGSGTQQNLEYLGLSNNNLLELNSCLPTCTKLKTLQCEFNPLRSPPPELLTQGLDVLRRYCDLRDKRIVSVQKVLTDYGYDYDPNHLTPEAYRVLTSGKTTGFLTEDDLENFDKAVDRYLNGAYYSHSATDADVIERLDSLKQEREHVFYNAILRQLIDTLKHEVDLKQKSLFGPGALLEERRPWGRQGELIGCYAISLDALVRESQCGLKEPRPALFSIAKAKMPPSPFGYTLELLKDAITKYAGPYGPVAQLDKVQFDRCDCVDNRGRSKGHKPCVLPSVIIVKSIYTVGEAQRRAAEDDAIEAQWSKTWETLTKQLDSRLGRLMASQELFKRKRDQEKILQGLKTTLKERQKDLKRNNDFLQAAKSRKEAYDDGANYGFHRIDSPEEAEDIVNDAEKHVTDAKHQCRQAEKAFEGLKQAMAVPKKLQLQKIGLDLKQKYCVLDYEHILDDNRRKAFDNHYRRSWDGDEGMDYRNWTTRNGAALVAGKDVITLPRWATILAPRHGHDDTNKDKDKDQDDQVSFDYNWVGTDNMDLFKNERYFTFEESHIKDIVDKLQKKGNKKKTKQEIEGAS